MKRNNKGFTLAELLIVVAIIGVLVAIAMPTFGKQLEKARVSADQANLRAAYGEAVAVYLTNEVHAATDTHIEHADQGNTVTVKDIQFTHKNASSEVYTATVGFPFSANDTAAGNLNAQSGKMSVTFTFGTDGTTSITAASGTALP